MKLRMIYKNEQGSFNYVYKESEKTFQESKDALNIIFEKCKPLIVFISTGDTQNSEAFLNDRNSFLPVTVDNLISVSPNTIYSLPQIFRKNKESQNSVELESFWTGRMFDSYFPIFDKRKIFVFFREFFIQCEITQELFDECILSHDEFDYEKPMDGNFIYEEIEFIQSQIEFILNRILINFKSTKSSNSNLHKYVIKLSNEQYENEIEFLRQFIVEEKIVEKEQEDNGSSFFDRYDMGTWMKK